MMPKGNLFYVFWTKTISVLVGKCAENRFLLKLNENRHVDRFRQKLVWAHVQKAYTLREQRVRIFPEVIEEPQPNKKLHG